MSYNKQMHCLEFTEDPQELANSVENPGHCIYISYCILYQLFFSHCVFYDSSYSNSSCGNSAKTIHHRDFFSAGLQDDNDNVGLVWGKYANLQLCLQKRAELRLAAGNSKSCVSWIKHTWKKMSVSVFKGIKLKCLANRRLPDK